jgi:hypothetical protein
MTRANQHAATLAPAKVSGRNTYTRRSGLLTRPDGSGEPSYGVHFYLPLA